MATMRTNSRLQVGSSPWIEEERSSALQIAEAEAEEFTYSARNEVDWLNEHMAEIFSKNQVNVAEIFKTPGKLRGKTPRTARKNNQLGARVPLSDVFSATPQGRPSPLKQLQFEKAIATFQVAEDEPVGIDLQTEPNPSPVIAEDSALPKPTTNLVDSGYHGSQPEDVIQATQPNDPTVYQETPNVSPPRTAHISVLHDAVLESTVPEDQIAVDEEPEERRSTEGSFQSAKEEQTRYMTEDVTASVDDETTGEEISQPTYPVLESPLQNRTDRVNPPQKRSPERQILERETSPGPEVPVDQTFTAEDEHMADVQSPSDNSSPIRHIIRKSSLNFASLPAREPLTTKKSIGNRVSRTSQLEQSRTSYYGRHTGGKSLGNAQQENEENDDDDEMEVDELEASFLRRDDAAHLHNKTSTQRLQDQISMLGQSQSNTRQHSKSIPSSGVVSLAANQPIQVSATHDVHQESPQRRERPPPGAFPDDEDDSWIGPPNGGDVPDSIFSPRPQMTKSHSTDVMEDIRGKDSVAGAQFNIPKRGEDVSRRSPLREPTVPVRTTSTFGHIKSVSTSVLRSPKKAGEPSGQKHISVSNPNPSTIMEDSTTPPKSPTRSHRGSPLKAAKDKFSSILKTSRGLFASSAAISADAKSSAPSPPSRIALNSTPSMESIFESQPSYPQLDAQATDIPSQDMPNSPGKASVRKTRASSEREERMKQEEVKEAKEAQKLNDQLEKARQQVKDEARLYYLEQERVAIMQKEVAARKEKENLAKATQADVTRATRTSPRKTKAQLEEQGIAAAIMPASSEDAFTKDTEMPDTSHSMLPPAVPRPKSHIGRPVAKRPLRPTKEATSKAKPPTIIRVDTGSQRGHQYHPSNTTLAATLQDSLTASQPGTASSQGTLRHKASTSSIQSKTSTSSFRSGATKALEAAARKKEQDELAAQRKREAKLEVERQRAAIKEEERRKEDQQRKQEAERQRDIQRERERAAAAADAKKAASRQAIEKRRLEMEKARETRAPPPAIRPQPSVDMFQDKALPPVPQPKPVRMNSAAPRSQEDPGRSVNSVMHSTAKIPPKRPLPQDSAEEHHSRPNIQRNGPSYQQNEQQTKRRKTDDAFDDDDETENHPKWQAPPIRQSSIRPKELPTKSIFPSGYNTVPQPTGNIQRPTLISQHNLNQSKPVHPMDMTQVSKAQIAFASSSSQVNTQSYKTPARPGAQNGAVKSTVKKSAKSSPRFQNGENIVLPEINTDSEDDDSEDEQQNLPHKDWTTNEAVTKAIEMQEELDPASIFGPPAQLDMEAVFSKSKDRFHKFRARTSSANWSGADRLTEEEIRKDIEGRDRMRRHGGWTYTATP